MTNNTVFVDVSVHPSDLVFSENFNAAVAFIDRHLKDGRGTKPAIITKEITWTYEDLAVAVNQAGNCLRSMGLAKGDRLMMVVTDGPEFISTFFGSIKIGVVPIAVNTMLRASDYSYLISDCSCKGLVYSESLSNALLPALEASEHKPYLVSSLEQFSQDASSQNKYLDAETATAMSECFWLYSSGSTGNPKGVVHPHRSMVCTSERFARNTVGLRESDIVFSASKLFHSYGFGNAMTFPLWVGATIVLSDERVSPLSSFEIIEKFSPSVFFGVPTLYAQQLQAMENCDPDFSSVRLCVSAGEALPGDVLRRWKEKTGTSIIDGLGSTENLHIFISNRPDDIKPGTSGKPVDGYQVKLVDEDEVEINSPNVIGTVWVKGESAAQLYWKNPEKTARTMKGDWLNTGDMYYRDEDGYYHNSGRGDDMMKVGGLWCSPFEIENRLIEHEKILEAAVVAKQDDDGLVKPAAYVVLNDARDATDSLKEILVQHCRAGLAHYKYPRWFYFVTDLPKTATGKIQRFRLRNQTQD